MVKSSPTGHQGYLGVGTLLRVPDPMEMPGVPPVLASLTSLKTCILWSGGSAPTSCITSQTVRNRGTLRDLQWLPLLAGERRYCTD